MDLSSDVQSYFDVLIGKPISHVWRGYGSAIFIEFGNLTPRTRRNGEPGEPDGEITLMIGWSWRIENPRSILCGSWSEENRWQKAFTQLLEAKATSVQVFGVLPEIMVCLDNGMRIASFMTAEGQPSWALIDHRPGRGSLHVERGKLHVEGINNFV